MAKSSLEESSVEKGMTKGTGPKLQLQDSEVARLSLSVEQQNAISQLYRKTYLDLKKQMDTLSHEGSTSESLQKTYLNKLVKQLKESYKSIGTGLEEQIKKDMETVSSSVVKDVNAFAEKLGLKIEGAYSYVPKDIVSMLASGKVYGGDWSLSKSIWGNSQKSIQDINSIVAAGVAANKSAYEIAKDLEKYVDPSAKKDWEWSKVYPGTSKKVDYNAQRLARTMVSHAYQQSLMATTKHNPFVTGLRWRSAHSSRTCEICNGRDGTVYPKDDLPMDHPNGMCTFIAEIPDSMKDIADRLGDWANGKEDPALDNWYGSMIGGKMELKGFFDDIQKDFLGSMGYTPDKLPGSFDEWSHKLTSSQKSTLFYVLDLEGHPHPFQEMQKWYESELLNIEKRMVLTIPKPNSDRNLNSLGGAFSQARKDAALWAKSSKEADAHLRGKIEEVWSGSTKKDQAGAYAYTSGSGHMNRPLRSGASWNDESSKGADHINSLTQMCSKSTYDFDMWLQRGVSSTGAEAFLGISENLYSGDEQSIRKALLGSVHTDDAFLSTATAKGAGFSGHIFNIYAPSGTQMLYAEPFSAYSGQGGKDWDGKSGQSHFGSESEMIIQRGTSYRITKAEKSGGTWYFDMEVVAQDPLPEGQTHRGK